MNKYSFECINNAYLPYIYGFIRWFMHNSISLRENHRAGGTIYGRYTDIARRQSNFVVLQHC